MKAIANYFYPHKVKYSEMQDKKNGGWKRNNTSYCLLSDCSPTQANSEHDNNISNSDPAVAIETGIFASFSSTASIPTAVKCPSNSKWGRPTLPVTSFSRNDFSVWSILKQCIGKELSKITMPVVFNEPISFLQRLSENMEYSHLLEKASNSEDPVKRMEYVAAFAVSSISSNWDRLGKPFNPLLGETYELVREDDGFRIVTEQVSHHPPITAFHADSPHFVFSGAIHPKLKLWARSVEVKPEGTVILRLLKHNETYTWSGITCCVHNIIVGKLWMEQCGAMAIKCQTSGLVCDLNFKPAGWYGVDLNCVEGFILDKEKTRLKFIYGKWSGFIRSMDVQYYDDYVALKDQNAKVNSCDSKTSSSKDYANLVHPRSSLKKTASLNDIRDSCDTDALPSCLLWEIDSRPAVASEYYNFTSFAMALNEINQAIESTLPATDSRLRPDIRKLEEGDVDGAAFEKNRLEEKQREARKQKKKEKTTWRPLWFDAQPHPYTKEEAWSYNGSYWNRNFTNCPNIF